MFAAVPVGEVVAVQVVLLFPVISMQDVWLRRVVQVGHGQLDGFLQGAEVHLHVAGRQFQFRLQGLAVLAHGVLDQVAAEVPVDLQEVAQAPGDLTIGQATEAEVPLVGISVHAVQLLDYLRHEGLAVGDAGLDRFFRGHVAALQVVEDFLPMLGVLQAEIS